MKRNRKRTRRNRVSTPRLEQFGTSNLFRATLLNPIEVERNSKNCEQYIRENLKSYWALLGSVGQKMMKRLQANAEVGLPTQLTSCRTGSGAAYAVLVCQLDDTQSRFILPLYDSSVIAFFAAALSEPFNLRLQTTGSCSECLVYKCILPEDDIRAVLDMCVEVDYKNVGEFPSELALFVNEMLTPNGMPAKLSPVNVRDVDLSVLMPKLIAGKSMYEATLDAAV